MGPWEGVIKDNGATVDHTDEGDRQWLYIIPEIVGLDTVEIEVQIFPHFQEQGFGRHEAAFISLRNNGSILSGYALYLHLWSFQVASVQFARNNEAFPPAISEKQIAWPGPGIVKLRFEANGGVLKAYVNGVLVHSVTDPSPLPAGHPGMGFTTNITPMESDVRITSYEVRACPPVSDPILNDPAVRQGLKDELALSRPNPDGSGRAERRGYVYQRDDGSYFLMPANDPTGTMCGFTFSDLPIPPTIPGATFKGDYHTHPSKHLEVLTGCPGQKPGEVWKANRKANTGGGSEGDWEFTDIRGKSHYILDQDQKVWRLDPNTLPGARKNNPNRWKFPSGAGNCLVPA